MDRHDQKFLEISYEIPIPARDFKIEVDVKIVTESGVILESSWNSPKTLEMPERYAGIIRNLMKFCLKHFVYLTVERSRKGCSFIIGPFSKENVRVEGVEDITPDYVYSEFLTRLDQATTILDAASYKGRQRKMNGIQLLYLTAWTK